MLRAAKWLSRGNKQWRALTFAAGAGLTVGAGALQERIVVHADSAQSASGWSSKPTVISHNSTLAQRGGQQKTSGRSTSDVQSQHTSTEAEQVPPETRGHSTFESEGDYTDDESSDSLRQTNEKLATINDGFAGFDFAAIRNKLSDMILPSWVKYLPGFVAKLQSELSMAPWSLGWEIWEEAHDPEINPEITWDADVRVSDELCKEEQAFLRKRKIQTAKALAHYLDVPENEVLPDDVPVIAMCGSGGGLRALVAGTSSYLSTDEAGLFDCVTYTAGVSGSCWLQTLYNSSIGQQSYGRLIEHYKQRLGVHIAFPPAAFSLLAQAPTNKFLLSGMVEKMRGVPDADFGLVDVYGLLLAARLLVPKGELRVSDSDLKVSNQRSYTDHGKQPLPIYTAVRHEIPKTEEGHPRTSEKAQQDAISEAWFQWFEWTPYEFFCEEFQTGIPTWAVGRRFDQGHSQWRENGLFLPEIRVPLMMGIWGSAFCATLSHYYKEIRPIITSLGFGGLDNLMADKDEDLIKVHPIDPASIPNFALGMRGKLPSTCPESIHHDTHLRLMDAGMSNNLPIYPLLRPGREVDVIIAFDASADVKTDNWIQVADGYARQRGIKGWPVGAGWPPQENKEKQTMNELESAQVATARQADERLQAAQKQDSKSEGELGYCTVWVGTTEERQTDAEPPTSKKLKIEGDDAQLTSPNAGLTLIYFPFLANEKVPGVDPMKSEFMSTWNFIYKPEEIDKVVALARANFNEGKDQTRRTIKAIWQRKREKRLQREKDEREFRRRARMRRGEAIGRKGSGDHGDHFS